MELREDGDKSLVRTWKIANLDNLRLDTLPNGGRAYVARRPVGHPEMSAVGYEEPRDRPSKRSLRIVLSGRPRTSGSPA